MRVFLPRLEWLLERVLGAIFLATLSAGVLQVVNRYAIGWPIAWTEEVQRYLHIWLIFLAIPLAIRRGSHLSLQILPLDRLAPGFGRAQRAFVKALWVSLGLLLSVAGWNVTDVAAQQVMPALEISMAYAYLAPCVGGVLIVVMAMVSDHPVQSDEMPLEEVQGDTQ